MNISWTIDETNYLKTNYELKSDYEIGIILHKTTESIRGKRNILNLHRDKLISNKMRSESMKKARPSWSNKRKTSTYSKRRMRLYLLEKFGGKCVNCGNEDLDILEFDHINNDGYLYRQKETYSFIERNPSLFQLLCPNCNKKKRLYHMELMRLERENTPPF